MGRRIENEGPADAGPCETARHSARGMHPIRILFVSDLLEAQWCLSQLQAAEFNVQADVVPDAVKAAGNFA